MALNAGKAYAPLIALVAVLGVLYIAWTKFTGAVEKNADAARKAVDEYEKMDRAQLAAMSRTAATAKSAAASDQYKADLEALKDVSYEASAATQMIQSLKRTMAQQDPNDAAMVKVYADQLTYWRHQEELLKGSVEEKSAEVVKSATAMQGYADHAIAASAAAGEAAQANESLTRSFKDLEKAMKEIPDKLDEIKFKTKALESGASPTQATNAWKITDSVGQYNKRNEEYQRRFVAELMSANNSTTEEDRLKAYQTAIKNRDALLAENRRVLDLQVSEVSGDQHLKDLESAYKTENKKPRSSGTQKIDGLLVHVNDAWEKMRAAALEDGVKLIATSKGRTLEQQNSIWQATVAKRGLEGARGIATPPGRVSAHVRGKAIDIAGGGGAADWLAQNAGEYGFGFPVPKETPRTYRSYGLSHVHAQMLGDASGGESAEARQMAAAEKQAEKEADKRVALEQRSSEAIAQSKASQLELDKSYAGRRLAIEAQRDEELLTLNRKRNGDEILNEEAKAERIKAIRATTDQRLAELDRERADYNRETSEMELDAIYAKTSKETQLAYQTAKEIAAIQREQLKGTIANAEEAQARIDAVIAKYKQGLEDVRATKIEEWTSSVGQAFGEAFGSLARGGEKAKDVLKRLVESLRDMAIQMAIIKPLSELIGGFMDGAISGKATKQSDKTSATQALGSAAGAAASKIITNAIMSFFADGGSVNASLPYGLYTRPTYFPMSSPGNHAFAAGTGLLGEAGPELVLPAVKMPNGKLGVGTNGTSGNPQLNVVVNNTAAGEGFQAKVKQDGNKLTLDIVKDIVRSTVASDLSGGTDIARALAHNYPGMRRGNR
jgi:LAS superfamily LD-carboxypeptidase LdcB